MTIAPVSPAEIESLVRRLSGEQLSHLGSVFQARAHDRRRTLLTEEDAAEAVRTASLTAGWQLTQYPEVGQVRIATRVLIERGWQPEQVIPAMGAVAERLIRHDRIATEAVAAGIADGMWSREGVGDGD